MGKTGKIYVLVMLKNTLLAHSIFIISSFFLWYLNTEKMVIACDWLKGKILRELWKWMLNYKKMTAWFTADYCQSISCYLQEGVKSTSVCCPWIPHWVSLQSVSLMFPTQQLPLQIVFTLSFNCQLQLSTFSSSSSSPFRISAYDFRRTGSWREKFKFTA